MRGSHRKSLSAPRRKGSSTLRTALVLGAALALGASACGQGDGASSSNAGFASKSSGPERAARRLYDGAPPIIPHESFGAACTSCHDADGISVPGVGFAPASPHEDTGHAHATSRCLQCHVFIVDHALFARNAFEGLPQDLRPGDRPYEGAPPTIPHTVLMRENCAACHVGPGARAEIVTTHPERTRCLQCHVPVLTQDRILSYGEIGLEDPEGS